MSAEAKAVRFDSYNYGELVTVSIEFKDKTRSPLVESRLWHDEARQLALKVSEERHLPIAYVHHAELEDAVVANRLSKATPATV